MIQQPKGIPHTPGVYIFSKGKTPIYIGKAADLKKRLVSYWRKNAGQKIAHLLDQATGIEWKEAASEADALLKEASLIKQHIPKYNIVMRDDKNYFYMGVTREVFPRIFITHQMQSYEAGSHKIASVQYIGPFTSGGALKSTLWLLRGIFPYCTCKRPHKRPCLNAQIGRCPGYCCIKKEFSTSSNNKIIVPEPARLAEASAKRVEGLPSENAKVKEYFKNIKNIIAVLNSKRKKLLAELKKQMRSAAKNEDFERAAKLRDQIAGIENIFSHRQLFEVGLQTGSRTSARLQWHKIARTIQSILGTKYGISRVEGYDISNISGTEATGSMAVFIDGIPAKSEYRKFKIKTIRQPSDADMLKEVIRRRIRHKEWNLPDLMLIDGGKPQLNAVTSVIRPVRSQTPSASADAQAHRTSNGIRHRILLAGLAKREEELYILNRQKPIRLDTLPPSTAHFFQRVRDESHRFAKKYHHKLREMMYRI